MNFVSMRERDVLDCLSKGMTNEQTARSLFVSIETIRTHRKKLLEKLGAKNSFQLGMLAAQIGILQPTVKKVI